MTATSLAPRRGGRVLIERFVRNPSGVVGLALVIAVAAIALLADWISEPNPFLQTGTPLQSPSGSHLMGTDQFGRDLFSGVAHGARTSLTLVAGVGIMTMVLGLFIGAMAGSSGGLLDDFLMRLAEIVQTVPRFFLAILVIAVFGPSITNLLILFGLTSWPFLARVIRAEALTLRSREFVEAARSSGASRLGIVTRHVLPNVMAPAMVVIALVGSRVILLEAGLAFAGLTDPNRMSWGLLIKNADAYLRVAWWLSVLPGAAIVTAVLGLNLVSDGLNDVLDPSDSRVGGTSVVSGKSSLAG